jgi:aspartate-semialdehyde dehydrogenase
LEVDLPGEAGDLPVLPCTPEAISAPLVFSALDASVAGEIEQEFADAGRQVVTNSGNHRMDDEVPLIVPEVNPDHLAALARRRERGVSGAIVANPNCTTVGLVLALAPLHEAFGVREVSVVSLQALSGAGLPGPSALSMLGNVSPHIPGEEDKVVRETQKILGQHDARVAQPADVAVSAACHRVPVRDGHLLAVSVRLGVPAGPPEAKQALAEFRGHIGERQLPSAPARPLVVRDEPERPQPWLDRDCERGMAVVVGPVSRCPVLGIKFRALVHNTVRGAAGAALLNAELLRDRQRAGQGR